APQLQPLPLALCSVKAPDRASVNCGCSTVCGPPRWAMVAVMDKASPGPTGFGDAPKLTPMSAFGSQASPRPSPSKSSSWPSGLNTVGQLSTSLSKPSPSWSPSQTSPVPSPSASSWPGLNSSGQLSSSSGMPSLSSSSSQRLPTRSPSVSVWSSLSSNGQLSNRSHQLSLSALAEGSAAQPGYR